ncbi:hypothetical protein C0971_06320 [Bacillus methanolicus]|uniref:Flagellar hook-length control protein-like C-terminal domain-containing protein n=1 Tax=Bacillus methanolicus (strain MGA3 / ATCC 53907) TaxID=796606 RepID=A0A068LVT1_BACMM|nr:hypothetical protein [Bacillus methanolicus]AIE59637.1 hypothetical protein BMMGA3_06045 [Bacillus methanolicus MGA3]UQD51693.1 hypothetical protein C0971_06320 [Bacillus methanolicus]
MERVMLTLPLFKQNNLYQSEAAVFRPGQIFQGKVTKIFPNQTAEVQVGSQKFIALLEAPLFIHERYLFQVQPGEGKIHLKVLSAQEGGPASINNAEQALTLLKLPVTKENMEIIRSFLQNELPISKEIIQLSSEWLKTAPSLKEGLEVIKQMFVKNLPFSKGIFNALSSLQKNEPLHSIVNNLLSLLKETELSETGTILKNTLSDLMMAEKENVWGQSQLIAVQLKKLISHFGFNYEHNLHQFVNNTTKNEFFYIEMVKPLLIKFLNEHPPIFQKEAAEQLLNRITGLQVLSQEIGPIMQFAVQIPICFWNKTTDLTMQWSGRRKPNGKIDPDFCRILFYLDLEHIKETMIDMQVQNRIMRITVINENQDLKKIAIKFLNELKEKLSALHFHLSAVHFETPHEQLLKPSPAYKKLRSVYDPNKYQGVDLKI